MQEDTQIVHLRAQGLTWPAIGRRIGRSGDAVRRRHKRLGSTGALTEVDRFQMADRFHVYTGPVGDNITNPTGPTYDDLAAQWDDWLGRSVKKVKSPRLANKGSRRVGIISDTHAPYEDWDVLAALAADGPYDLIIHGGDLLDWHAVSSFAKRKHVDPKLEVQHGTLVLEKLAGIAVDVEVVSDNHSKRLLKAISRSNLPGDLMDLLQWFEPELDLFRVMSRDFPNVKIADPVEVVEGVHFFGQWGDLIVGHAETSSVITLRAAEKLDKWLTNWGGPLELNPWRVVAQAHTHQLAKSFPRGGHFCLMETGACCTLDAMSYAMKGGVGWRPPVPSYTTLTQRRNDDGDWETDFNSIRQVVMTAASA